MASYRDSLRDRLTQIDDLGANQTTWERLQSQRKQAERRYQEDFAMRAAQGRTAMLGQQNANSLSLSPSGSSGFQQFMNSIAKKESGGNYGVVNKHSGAMGKYQIMPSNIVGAGRGWDYEALGHDVSTSQFISSPQIQEKIAQYKLQQYYNKYGPAGASIAWYAGPKAANTYVNGGGVSNVGQGLYPSVQNYMNSILGAMKWH